MNKTYQIAKAEIGQAEVTGGENPRILEYHAITTLAAKEDEISWCAAFVGWCLEQAGIRSTRLANARSYLDWGKDVENPFEGCVVVLKRGREAWQGHVGFFVRCERDVVYILGGNQGNQVCIKPYPLANVLAYREPGLVEEF